MSLVTRSIMINEYESNFRSNKHYFSKQGPKKIQAYAGLNAWPLREHVPLTQRWMYKSFFPWGAWISVCFPLFNLSFGWKGTSTITSCWQLFNILQLCDTKKRPRAILYSSRVTIRWRTAKIPAKHFRFSKGIEGKYLVLSSSVYQIVLHSQFCSKVKR